MRKYLRPLTFVVIGIVLLIAGFVYAVIFLNVPYPDPTPAMQQEVLFHERITGNVMLAGIVFVIVSMVWAIIGKLLSIFKRSAAS